MPRAWRAHAGELAQVLLDAHASNMALGLAPGLTRDRAAAECETPMERLDVLLAAVDDDGAVFVAGGLIRGCENGRHRGEIQRLAGPHALLASSWRRRHRWTRYAVVDGWAERPGGELVANAFFSLALPGRTTP